MDDLLAARLQMALSLGFHIIFASIGIAMPFLMASAHFLYLRSGEHSYFTLTKAWSKGVAIFFAVGAVSGTLLSFELGLLWPKFMEHAGPIIGMPFSWEGAAFFIEAIALGIFLYGWDKINPWMHWLCGVIVGLSGVASGFFVICANAWMNSPAGFDWNNGHPINIDPWAAMFNDAAWMQGLHMIVAAFEAVGFAVAGVHAWLYLHSKYQLHAHALRIALVIGGIAALVQPIIGDLSAKSVARRQPIKLAAMEGHFETQTRAPLAVGGYPNTTTEKMEYAIEIPGALSFLAYGSFSAEVKGLKDFPRSEWPPVAITHIAFQIMVGLGTLLAGLGALGMLSIWKFPHIYLSRRYLWALVLAIPLGFIAIEAGWVVTEVGRQPWIIYGILKTSEALTSRPGLVFNLAAYAFMYVMLSFLVGFLLVRQTKSLQIDLLATQGDGASARPVR